MQSPITEEEYEKAKQEVLRVTWLLDLLINTVSFPAFRLVLQDAKGRICTYLIMWKSELSKGGKQLMLIKKEENNV